MSVEPVTAAESGDFPESGRFEAEVQAYEAAKTRYIRSETSLVEAQLRDAFVKRRAEVTAEIEGLRDLYALHQNAATVSARRYAALYPKRVQKSGIQPPSLWERIVTLNRVDRLYSDAKRCAAEVDEVKIMVRKRHERLDSMEQETRRSIYLREEAVRKSLQTPEGLVALQRDPYVRAAYAKMQAAQTQRVEYDERVLQGAVAPDQARDRDMEERGMTFASVPMNGVVIAGITRYGNLAYYVLRDDVDAPSLLSCDPALEPLRDYVFDVVRSDGGFTASLRYAQDGVPMRVLDQLKSSTANGDVAERYANHRAALRSQRATAKTPVVDQVEAQIIEALLRLAGSLTA